MAKTFGEAISAGVAKPTDLTDWRRRHYVAAMSSGGLNDMLRGWYNYAQDHEAKFGSKIGDDSVLGPEWAQIGYALRGLLNGDIGQLDGGTCDSFIVDTMTANNVEVDE